MAAFCEPQIPALASIRGWLCCLKILENLIFVVYTEKIEVIGYGAAKTRTQSNYRPSLEAS